MNNIELAKSNLRQVEERFKHAKEALEAGNYPYVIRQCQEAVELSLKAALRIAGVEPPKWHDVGPILRRERLRFPQWFQEIIDELASISRSLRREREFSMYGDEETGVSAEELYTKIDALQAVTNTEKILKAVNKLLSKP